VAAVEAIDDYFDEVDDLFSFNNSELLFIEIAEVFFTVKGNNKAL